MKGSRGFRIVERHGRRCILFDSGKIVPVIAGGDGTGDGGGSGDAGSGEGGSGGSGGDGGGSGDGGSAKGSDGGKDGDGGDGGDGEGEKGLGDLPEPVRAELSRARGEAAKYRTQAREAKEEAGKVRTEFEELKKGLLGALGGGSEDGEKKPEELVQDLQKQIDDFKNEQKQGTVRDRIRDQISEEKLHPKLALAALDAEGKLQGLLQKDPEDGTLQGEIEKAVQGIAESYPQLKDSGASGGGKGKGPGDLNGGGSSKHDKPAASLREALDRRYEDQKS